jgi:hypothetical protein
MIDVEKLKTGIRIVIMEHLATLEGDLKDEYQKRVEPLIEEAALYVTRTVDGDPQWAHNLEHLELQAGLIGAQIAIREAEELAAVLQQTVNMVVRAAVAGILAAA